jgi:serine/threonine-protein kinase
MNADAAPLDSPTGQTDSSASRLRQRIRETLRSATLGEYEIYEELGHGGMAVVFLGHDIALERYVAIKVMPPDQVLVEGAAERFRREARIAAGLNHPHIIPVYAVRETDLLSFFVMKYVDGPTLDALIKEHAPLPPSMVQALLIQVAGALGFAHRQGVVHRDVKPANVLLDTNGWAVVTDFGIARASGLPGITATGTSVGTPSYMSPEQCSRAEVSGQSDQYALGVMAYEMLCGRLPINGRDTLEVMQSHILDAAPSILEQRPDCPAGLAQVVMRMLEKKPADRWASLEEAIAALEARSSGPKELVKDDLIALARSSPRHRSLPVPPSSPTPISRRIPPAPVAGARPSLRRRRVLVGAVLSTVMLSAVAIGSWLRFGSEREQRVGPDSTALSGAGVLQIPAAAPVPDTGNAPATAGDSATAATLVVEPPSPGPSPTPERRRPVGPLAPRVAAATPDTAPSRQTSTPSGTLDASWVLLGTRSDAAFLYINGQPQLPKAPSLRWWKVPPGRVALSLLAEGCTPWEEVRTLAPGDSVRIGYRYPTCPP